jgi:hypothetical protein
MTRGLWLDLVLAVATAVLWIWGIAMLLSDKSRAEAVLVAAFLVGIVFCLRTWWRGRRDPDGPSLIHFLTRW